MNVSATGPAVGTRERFQNIHPYICIKFVHPIRIGITSKQTHANFVNFHSLQKYIAQILRHDNWLSWMLLDIIVSPSPQWYLDIWCIQAAGAEWWPGSGPQKVNSLWSSSQQAAVQQFLRFIRLVSNYLLELQKNIREDFKITEKSPTRTSSWLKALSNLRHYYYDTMLNRCPW